MSQVVLINVSGRDRPGITSGLSSILAKYQVTVLDIDQAVIHNNLSWGMLVDLDVPSVDSVVKPAGSDALFKELLFKAHDLDLNIRFTPISSEAYSRWVDGSGHDRHIITLLGRRLGADLIAKVTAVISKLN